MAHLALALEGPLGLLDNRLGQHQPQARTVGLCREKGLKRLPSGRLIHPMTGVGKHGSGTRCP